MFITILVTASRLWVIRHRSRRATIHSGNRGGEIRTWSVTVRHSRPGSSGRVRVLRRFESILGAAVVTSILLCSVDSRGRLGRGSGERKSFGAYIKKAGSQIF